MIQVICQRHRHMLSVILHNNDTITFKLGVSNERVRLIDFLLLTVTSHISSYPFFFIDCLLFFFLFALHSSYISYNVATITKFFPVPFALQSLTVQKLFMLCFSCHSLFQCTYNSSSLGNDE